MQTGDWPQCLIEFADRQTAEHVAAEQLRRELATAEADGLITTWFFIRKAPCWRLRYLPAGRYARQRLHHALDTLAADGRIAGWTQGIYEPEVLAFGGSTAMHIAHELFHHDSRRILDHLALNQNPPPGPPALDGRALAVLLPSVLMRAAGQDWYEQGDIWARVAQLRPSEHPAPAARRLRAVVQRLMTLDVGSTSPLVDGGPLAETADWFAAFEHAGHQLAALSRRGDLHRGLRAVLTHHVIFHWNRLGLPYAEQSTLATLAKEVVMGTSDSAASAPKTSTSRNSLPQVDTKTTPEEAPTTTATSADRLRHALADRLRAKGTVRTDRVDAALRTVPRHLFLPAVPVEEAYADEAVYTKQDASGTAISAASQPTIVALMLEQLRAEPGQRILELGAGTGYNAALLAHLVGQAGHVTTVDVDDDIVVGARSGLAAAGIGNVDVILGDGALGHLGGAPYDRIVATVGAHGIPSAWLDQLAPDGRLVVPLRVRGSVSRSIAFEREDGRWRSQESEMCTFMPLRGIADDARRIIPLTEDSSVTLVTNQEQAVDAAALTGVLDQPRSDTWTGVCFRGQESFEWLDLWLTCTMPGALSRMPATQQAMDKGLVRPMFGWGAMATAEEAGLAYLTLRDSERADDGSRRYEVGVIAHGRHHDDLANRVAGQIRTWDRDYRGRAVEFEIQPLDAEVIEPAPGRFAFDTTANRLVIAWQ